MSLRYKILLIVILAIVLPALFFSVILTTLSRKYISESIIRQQQEIVRRVKDQITSQIDKHIDILYVYQDLASLPRAKQLQVGRDILAPYDRGFSEISLLNAAGQEQWKFRVTFEEVNGTRYKRVVPANDLVNRSRRGEFITAARDRKLFISPVTFSNERQPYVVMSAPLTGRSGVLVAKLNLDQMWEWIKEVKIGETGIAFAVDRKGILIAHPDNDRVLAHSDFSQLPVVQDFLKKDTPRETWSTYTDERGRKVVSLFEALPDNLGWAVFTQIPSKEVYAPIRSMYTNILLWSLFWTVVFLVVGSRLVSRIIQPLSQLEAGVKQVSEGKREITLNITTDDEIGALAQTFEKMATSLHQLEQVREDLTRMIIHDLKSPLSGIMGSLDYLESGLMGQLTDEQIKIVSLAKKSSESLLVMIQNLLDIAKMEEGKLELRREVVDIGALLQERRTQFEPLVRNENKTLAAEIAPNLAPVQAERHLIERVINNLITNAINHTTAGGAITLGAKKTGNFVEVRVSDNGAGVPPEYVDKIFEKFVQVERRRAHLRTGAGLGLTFCKMVVETHGGAIRVESEINRGSSFIFTLPL